MKLKLEIYCIQYGWGVIGRYVEMANSGLLETGSAIQVS